LRHLDGEHLAFPFLERPARPEDHALVIRIAGGDALGEEVAPLAPRGLRRASGSGEGERRAHRRGTLDELTAAQGHGTPPAALVTTDDRGGAPMRGRCDPAG